MRTPTRWSIAYALNRFRRTCWDDLVRYALGYDRDYWTLRWALRRNPECRLDAALTGVCYCGKIATQAALDGWPSPPRARVVLDQAACRRINAGGDR